MLYLPIPFVGIYENICSINLTFVQRGKNYLFSEVFEEEE